MTAKPERYTVQPSYVFNGQHVVLDTTRNELAKRDNGQPWRYQSADEAARKALELNRKWRRTATRAELNPNQQTLLPEPEPERRKQRRATRRKR